MVLAANGYEAKVSEALVQMLADSGTFQTWCGVPAQPKSRVVEDDGGEGVAYASDNTVLDPSTGNWAAVRLADPACRNITRAGFNTYGKQGSALITLVERVTAGDKPAEVIRRARNNAGLIKDEIQALFGASAARICAGEVSLGPTNLQDDTGALKGCCLTELPIEWRDLF